MNNSNTLTDPDKALAAGMTEAQLQACVVAEARRQGWLSYHTHDSRRSDKGFPDLVLIHTDGRLLWRELKTEKGRLRPEQVQWLAELTNAGQDAEVWRPADWVRGTIGRTLARHPIGEDAPWL